MLNVLITLLALPFTRNQNIFAVVFLLSFILLMVWAYKSDSKTNKKFFKNVWIVLVVFIAILIILFALIKILH